MTVTELLTTALTSGATNYKGMPHFNGTEFGRCQVDLASNSSGIIQGRLTGDHDWADIWIFSDTDTDADSNNIFNASGEGLRQIAILPQMRVKWASGTINRVTVAH